MCMPLHNETFINSLGMDTHTHTRTRTHTHTHTHTHTSQTNAILKAQVCVACGQHTVSLKISVMNIREQQHKYEFHTQVCKCHGWKLPAVYFNLYNNRKGMDTNIQKLWRMQ